MTSFTGRITQIGSRPRSKAFSSGSLEDSSRSSPVEQGKIAIVLLPGS